VRTARLPKSCPLAYTILANISIAIAIERVMVAGTYILPSSLTYLQVLRV